MPANRLHKVKFMPIPIKIVFFDFFVSGDKSGRNFRNNTWINTFLNRALI